MCNCVCQRGGFCGGCNHPGCGRADRPAIRGTVRWLRENAPEVADELLGPGPDQPVPLRCDYSGCNKIIGETQRGVVGNGSSIYCNNNCMGLDAEKDRPRPGSRAYGVGPGPNSRPLACPCECNSGGFCGGCGHAGCGGR
jgi:hypothetical protein